MLKIFSRLVTIPKATDPRMKEFDFWGSDNLDGILGYKENDIML